MEETQKDKEKQAAKEDARVKAKAAAEERDEDEDEDDEEEESDRSPKRSAAASTSKGARAATTVEVMRPQPTLLNIWTIMLRELRSYFDSLIAYVVLGISMFGLGIWFFFLGRSFWEVDRASMSYMFEHLPWALSAVVVPLVTMRSIAEEKRTGTIELLITLPVKDSEVIMGKYLGALSMSLILLCATLLYPLLMFVFPWHMGPLDWGPVWSSCIGIVLFSAAATALGIFFSGITESQIIAFFATAATLLGMQVIGMVVESVRGWQGDALAFLSFEAKYAPFARGIVDTRAIVYFLSFTVVFLLLAFRSLESRKWR